MVQLHDNTEKVRRHKACRLSRPKVFQHAVFRLKMTEIVSYNMSMDKAMMDAYGSEKSASHY